MAASLRSGFATNSPSGPSPKNVRTGCRKRRFFGQIADLPQCSSSPASGSHEKEAVYLPLHGFTAVDLGYEKGNAVSNFVNRIDEAPLHDDLSLAIRSDLERRGETRRCDRQALRAHRFRVSGKFPPAHLLPDALQDIFSEFLEDISADVLPNDRTGYQESLVWKKLFNFQRDAANGIINKLRLTTAVFSPTAWALGRRHGSCRRQIFSCATVPSSSFARKSWWTIG